ncbi:MAG: preprotein translocase subunit SecE [Miltoncostaeaceae bacterium]
MARIRPARGQDGPGDGDEPGPGGARTPKPKESKRAGAGKAPSNPRPTPQRRKEQKAGSYTKAVAAERKGSRFITEVAAELRKVSWPNRSQLAQGTAITLVVVGVVAAYLAALDAVFRRLIDSIF